MLRKPIIIFTMLITFGAIIVCSIPSPDSASEPEEVAVEPDTTAAVEPTQLPEVVMGALTAQEFYNLALAEAQAWQSDAVLSRLDSGGVEPLDSEGRGAGWSAEFWSPSAEEINGISLVNGEIISTSMPYPTTPEITPDMDSVNLDVKSFLDIAVASGEEEIFAEEYIVSAGLRPYVADNSIPAWTIIYLKPGSSIPFFTVMMDARNGEVLRTGAIRE